MIESSTDLLREGIGQWKVDTWHRYQRRERDLQVSLVPFLHCLSSPFFSFFSPFAFPLSLLLRLFLSLHFFLLYLAGEHLGRRWHLHRRFSFDSFISVRCSSVFFSSSRVFVFLFFFFLSSTPARSRCLYPCCCHHLPLSGGSFAPLGPSLVALRTLSPSFFLFLFSLFLFAQPQKPPSPSRCCRPCGGLVLSCPALIVSGVARHPPWWFPLWPCSFLCKAIRVF